MSALREEMQAQGLFGFITGSSFAFCNGEHVTAVEISGAVQHANAAPVTANDDEMRDVWRSWITFLGLACDHDGIRVY